MKNEWFWRNWQIDSLHHLMWPHLASCDFMWPHGTSPNLMWPHLTSFDLTWPHYIKEIIFSPNSTYLRMGSLLWHIFLDSFPQGHGVDWGHPRTEEEQQHPHVPEPVPCEGWPEPVSRASLPGVPNIPGLLGGGIFPHQDPIRLCSLLLPANLGAFMVGCSRVWPVARLHGCKCPRAAHHEECP